MINEKRLLDEFLELVQTDSESHHEKVICELMKKKLEALGLEVSEFTPVTNYESDGYTLFARLPGTLPSAPILVSAHVDTVTPGIGVKPQVRDGAVYSDGTTILGADDKAGVVEILEAVRSIIENNIPHREVEIVFSIGEERGLHGAKSMDTSLLHSKQGYVLDTSGSVGLVVTKAPTSMGITFEITGHTAHAGGEPEKGINAIQAAALGISRMKLLRIDFETTANIGLIESKFPTNIVPDHCRVRGGARSRNAQKVEAQIDHMRASMQSACDELGATMTYKITKSYDLYDVPADSATVRDLGEAMERCGIKMTLGCTGGGSDANVYNKRGIESVVLACGMQDVHTTHEFVKIDDLTGVSRVMYALMTK